MKCSAADLLKGRVHYMHDAPTRFKLVWYVSNCSIKGIPRSQPVNSFIEAYAIVRVFERKARELALDFHFVIENNHERSIVFNRDYTLAQTDRDMVLQDSRPTYH